MRLSRLLLVVAFAAAATTPALAGPTDTAEERGRRPRCGGVLATIVGGPRDQYIVGTRRNDVIVGGGGTDFINGEGGDDIICGGLGNDLLDGGQGRDPLYGDAGRDYCITNRQAEHRLHHGCEVHQTDPTPPPPPGGSRAAPAAALRGGTWPYHAADTPRCFSPSAYPPSIDFGNLRVEGVGGRVAYGLAVAVLEDNGYWTNWEWANPDHPYLFTEPYTGTRAIQIGSFEDIPTLFWDFYWVIWWEQEGQWYGPQLIVLNEFENLNPLTHFDAVCQTTALRPLQ